MSRLKASVLAVSGVGVAAVILSGARTERVVNKWIVESSLSVARSGISAVSIQDGRIPITGGESARGAVVTADILSPEGSISVAARRETRRLDSANDSLAQRRNKARL
jgi:hypothetical protein